MLEASRIYEAAIRYTKASFRRPAYLYTFYQNKTVRCSDQCQEGRWHGMNKSVRTQSKHSITRVFFLYSAKNQNNFPTWQKINFLAGIEFTCSHLQLPWAFLSILVSLILLTLQGTEITACTSILPLENCTFFPLDVENGLFFHAI